MRFSTLASVLSLSLSLSIPAVLAQDDSAASSEPAVQIEHLITIEECEDRRTTNGDMVRMHYRGSLAEGDEFDNSYDRNQPLKFKLGAGRVIKGWEQGLLDMCPGEKRKLTIPPELGYGDKGVGPIPGGATLIFETEFVSYDDSIREKKEKLEEEKKKKKEEEEKKEETETETEPAAEAEAEAKEEL